MDTKLNNRKSDNYSDLISSKDRISIIPDLQSAPSQSQNEVLNNFSVALESISKSFLESQPKQVARFPGYVIRDFQIISDSGILFLLFKDMSILNFYRFGNEILKLEVRVTDDSLNTLVVDKNKNFAIAGGGLFEQNIYIYNLSNLELVKTLNANCKIKKICSSITHSFLVSVNSENGVFK